MDNKFRSFKHRCFLLTILTVCVSAASASDKWPNVDDNVYRIYQEFNLGPASSQDITVNAQSEISIKIFAQLSSPASAADYYQYEKTDEFPIQMTPLAKEGWPVGTGLSGGGTIYKPVDGKITLRVDNNSPVELIIAIVVPK